MIPVSLLAMHFRLRRLSVIFCVLVFITILMALGFSIYTVITTRTRGGPIYLGFNAIYLLLLLPSLFGILTEVVELLVIFVLCCTHSAVINIILLFIYTKIPTAIFIINFLVHTLSAVCAILYCLQTKREERLPEAAWKYAIKRLGKFCIDAFISLIHTWICVLLLYYIFRLYDGVIYGHHCGKKEVFYHQSAANNAGLPTPADPMGAVPQKAKRRLERDHGIMLL